MQRRGDDADWRLDTVLAGFDSSHVREGHHHPDHPVTAHAEPADVVEKDHAGRTTRLGRGHEHRADDHIRSARLIDNGRPKAIVLLAKTFELLGNAAAAKVRSAADNGASRLATR